MNAISPSEMTPRHFTRSPKCARLVSFFSALGCFSPSLPASRLVFCPAVQLMGCRKDGAREPTARVIGLFTEIPNYIPSVSLTC